MSSPKWTREQQAAIDLRGEILVAAAAGSGKTAVLVERLIKRITDPQEGIDVDRFLVVTFTNAAASEMRERIGKALEDAMYNQTNSHELEHLLQQRALLSKASITTLHSFCMEIIRQYFYQLDLDPAFRVADEAEADLLRQDIIMDIFEKYYESENKDFHTLVDAFGTDRDDQPLMELVLKLFNFSMSQPNPEKWLKGLARVYEWSSTEELLASPWGEVARESIFDKVEECQDLIKRAYKIAIKPNGPIQYAEVLQEDLARLELLEKSLKEDDWHKTEAVFEEAINFPDLPRGKKSKKQDSVEIDEKLQKALREESRKYRNDGKAILTKLKNDVFTFPLEEQLSLFKGMAEIIENLTKIVLDFAQEYKRAKQRRNIVDFSDLEHFALRLLENKEGEPTEIAKKLKDHFEEVLVDEYQDINPVQERILQLVSRQEGDNPNLFMVGDVKQSIYRFRMADPNLFLQKYSRIPHWSPDVKAESSVGVLDKSLDELSKESSGESANRYVIDLNRNFRSRREVIEGVNVLFHQIMTEGAGEIDYDDKAALHFGASFVSNPELKTAEGPIELHLYDPKEIVQNSIPSSDMTESSWDGGNGNNDRNDNNEENANIEEMALEDLETTRIEARLVAQRIQAMVRGEEFQIYDKYLADFRPVQYSDIVILMRSFASVAPIFTEEFQSAGIPVYAETNTGYFGAMEVETILSLLKVIDNPRLDIPLASVLRSPIVGMNGTELGRLRSLLPNGDFYEALVLAFWQACEINETEVPYLGDIKETLKVYEYSLNDLRERAKLVLENTPELKAKVQSFYPRLQEWRIISRSTSLSDFLWQLYEDTGYLAYVGTLPSGVQRQANLRVLYDRACRFEKTNYRGLFRFLRFLEKFQDQGKDLGNARTLGENENVVRLITVHASKGLEYPVVFVTGLGKEFNQRSLTGKLLLHTEFGAGVPIIDVENQIRYPSFIQFAVKQKLWRESLAEELRILYVALTRAKERLFLYGNVKDIEGTLLYWKRLGESCTGKAFPDSQLRSAKKFLDWIGPAITRQRDQSPYWEIIIHESLKEVKKNDDTDHDMDSDPQTINESEIEIETNQIETTNTHDDTNKYEDKKAFYREEVNLRLNWEYPYQHLINKPVKTSVSELKRRFQWYQEENTFIGESITPLSASLDQPFTSTINDSADSYVRPKFIQTKKDLTPAERGSIIHSLIQHIPLSDWKSKWFNLTPNDKQSYIGQLIESLVQRDIFTPEQSKVIYWKQIISLLDSDLGSRLLTADDVRREVPFTLGLKPDTQPEPILVQGVIDGIILSPSKSKAEVIDFKTDNVKDQQEPEKILIDRYALQLAIYAHAVERLLKVAVEQCTIYSLSLNREIIIPKERREREIQRLYEEINKEI